MTNFTTILQLFNCVLNSNDCQSNYCNQMTVSPTTVMELYCPSDMEL